MRYLLLMTALQAAQLIDLLAWLAALENQAIRAGYPSLDTWATADPRRFAQAWQEQVTAHNSKRDTNK